MLQRGDASRGSSAESARATLLQGGDASRGSSTESARATLLQGGDTPKGVGIAPCPQHCARLKVRDGLHFPHRLLHLFFRIAFRNVEVGGVISDHHLTSNNIFSKDDVNYSATRQPIH